MQDKISLVNSLGEIVGSIDKLEAHQKGLLHKAFSIFIFNNIGELLLQKRALTKYHSGGLWTNTCCSHPAFGEDLNSAIHRRMIEEMGFDVENLNEVYSFTYKVDLDNSLTEHEYDHVFVGKYNNEIIKPNPDEVCDYKWVSIDQLMQDAVLNPKDYTEWLKIILKDDKFLSHLV